ncbi:hypothetical protein [Chryseobacterium wangxinyae]|uniref:hypothetical protein n=1 Tax=Chryseobacterium sp. CY353 TaxID=2997334 RepID=UPI002271B608|nr:hypothetical protein [Chryseobacterium sp. CY353]MCY0970520.1 hypothetical protein [Chryseobacterium sp. CY353]
MNYQEALARVEKLQQYAEEYYQEAKYIVVPAALKDMDNFLKDREQSATKEVINCQAYSSDGIFSVYRIDLSSKNKKQNSTAKNKKLGIF